MKQIHRVWCGNRARALLLIKSAVIWKIESAEGERWLCPEGRAVTDENVIAKATDLAKALKTGESVNLRTS